MRQLGLRVFSFFSLLFFEDFFLRRSCVAKGERFGVGEAEWHHSSSEASLRVPSSPSTGPDMALRVKLAKNSKIKLKLIPVKMNITMIIALEPYSLCKMTGLFIMVHFLACTDLVEGQSYAI